MKSKVVGSFAVEAAVAAHPWKAEPDEKEAEDNLYQIALRYKHYEAVNTIAHGDIVTVTMESEARKFNRTAKLQVGGNLFDKQLEAELIGKTVGESGVCQHPTGYVRYTIVDAQRLIVPEVTDEMAKSAGIEGAETVDALRQHYVTESLKKALYDEIYYFVPEYLKKWQFKIEEADLYEMDEHEMERCRGISRSMGEVFDEMTEEQLLGAVGCPSIPAFREMIHGYHRKALQAMLVEAWFTGKNPAELTPEDANFYYGALFERIMLCALNKTKENTTC